MDHVASAFGDNDDLGRLIELGGSARGDDFELLKRVERGNFSFAALKGHFLVVRSIERVPHASVGVAAAGADRRRYAPVGELVLGARALHSGSKSDQAHHP